jgi:hypothetical protein
MNQPRGGATRAGATRLPPFSSPRGSAVGEAVAAFSALGTETERPPVGAVVVVGGDGLLGGAGSREAEGGGLGAGVGAGSTPGGATDGVRDGGLTTGAVAASTASEALLATSPAWAATPAPSSARFAPAGEGAAISPSPAAIAAAKQRNRRGPRFVRFGNWVLPSCSVRTDGYPLFGRIFGLNRARPGSRSGGAVRSRARGPVEIGIRCTPLTAASE